MERNTGQLATEQSTKKPRFRFGLRLIFGLMAVVGLLLGIVLPWHHRAQQQRAAIQTIELYGGRVAYDFQYNSAFPYLVGNPGEDPNMVCRCLGTEYFREPVFVVLHYEQDEFLATKHPPSRWIDENSETFRAMMTLSSGIRHLDIRFTKLSDLGFLKSFPNIEILDARDQGIEDLGPLKSLSGLKQLYLSNNPVADYSALGKLESLEVLEMRWHTLKDLDIRAGCEKLADVHLPGKELADISALAGKRELRKLDISHSQVTELQALDGLNLRQLNINMTGVSNIEPLLSSVDLEILDASSTQISDLSPLSDKGKLWRLFIVNSNVSDLWPLENLKQLQDLGFTGTQVVDGAVLLKLPKLRRCFVTPHVASKIGDKIPLGRN